MNTTCSLMPGKITWILTTTCSPHIPKMLFKALLCSKNKNFKKSYSVLEVIRNGEVAMKTTLEVKFTPVWCITRSNFVSGPQWALNRQVLNPIGRVVPHTFWYIKCRLYPLANFKIMYFFPVMFWVLRSRILLLLKICLSWVVLCLPGSVLSPYISASSSSHVAHSPLLIVLGCITAVQASVQSYIETVRT